MYLEDQQDAVLSSLYLFYCQVILHVSGVSRTHHSRAELHDYGIFLNGFYHCISKFMTCTSSCNYSLCTPDDGCGRHPKRVE
jgi:hypothetical protein